jgi:serine/threonine protein phosphatase PrpC
MRRLTRAAVVSDKGVARGNNEDSFFLNGRFMPLERMDEGEAMAEESAEAAQLYAVCDGIGGAEAGELASYTAVAGLAPLRETLRRCRGVRASINACTARINEAVREAGQGKGGCTMVLLCLRGPVATVAHLGDSRAYLRRGETLYRLTKDHTEAQRMANLGILSEAEAASAPGKNRLTHYLGMKTGGTVLVPSYAKDFRPRTGDKLLLCSDGVSAVLSAAELSEQLRFPPEEAAARLVSLSTERGSRDNMTALVVEVKGRSMLPQGLNRARH